MSVLIDAAKQLLVQLMSRKVDDILQRWDLRLDVCLVQVLLNWFGQDGAVACGHCSTCRSHD